MLLKDFLAMLGYQVIHLDNPAEVAAVQGKPLQRVVFVAPENYTLQGPNGPKTIPDVSADGNSYTVHERTPVPNGIKFFTRVDGTVSPLQNMPPDPPLPAPPPPAPPATTVAPIAVITPPARPLPITRPPRPLPVKPPVASPPPTVITTPATTTHRQPPLPKYPVEP